MTEFESQQMQLLTEIKNEVSTTRQYFIDRDTAEKLAAEQKAQADALLAQEAAEQKAQADATASQEAAEQVALEKQAEIDFRNQLLEKSTNTNDMLNLLTQVDYLSNATFNADADSPYLEQIASNTKVSDFQNEVGSLSYYSDIGMIILVFGVLPIYLAYRFIKPVIGMINKIL